MKNIIKEIDKIYDELKTNKTDKELQELKKQLEDIKRQINITIVRDYTLN